MLRHPLIHVRAGRYRARTAAEATAACGGNREPRLGPRSDFSKPCQGAAEKSANATRTGASRQIPSRFPTARNVYRDDCRFVVDGTGREQHVPSAAKAIKAPVGLWLVRGSQPVGMSTGMRERSGDFLWWTVQDSNRAAAHSAHQLSWAVLPKTPAGTGHPLPGGLYWE